MDDGSEMEYGSITHRERRRRKMPSPHLNRQRDLPLLSLIYDSGFISRPQIEGLLEDTAVESYTHRNRRLKRLAELGQLVSILHIFPILGVSSPSPGWALKPCK